jgi:hypothetical protein
MALLQDSDKEVRLLDGRQIQTAEANDPQQAEVPIFAESTRITRSSG